MLTQDAVSSMGLTFLCNRLVEGLYRFRQEKFTEGLKKAAEEAILELDSLRWPYDNVRLSFLESRIFRSNLPVKTLFTFWKDTYNRTLEEEDLNALIGDLKLITSEVPLDRKLETAEKLQKFFDALGDRSFYDGRDYERCTEVEVL